MNAIEARMEKLEKQNRRLRLAVGGLALVMLLAATLGAQLPNQAVDELRVKRLVIEDDQQNEIGFFGMREGFATLDVVSPQRQKSVKMALSDERGTLVLASESEGRPRVVMHCTDIVNFAAKKGDQTNLIDPRKLYVEQAGQPRLLMGVHDDKSRIGLFGVAGDLHWTAPPAAQ